MSNKIYHCKYGLTLENGEFRKEDVTTETHGLTDAFVLVSILRYGESAHDGAVDTAILSYDGQNNGEPIPDTEMFRTWSLMANTLINSEGCPPWQKEIAKQAFEAVREKITGMKTH